MYLTKIKCVLIDRPLTIVGAEMVKQLKEAAKSASNNERILASLSRDAQGKITPELEASGVPAAEHQEVLEEIETALGDYFEGRVQTKKATSRKEQRKNAIKIQNLVRVLRTAADDADGRTLKRLYMGMARKRNRAGKKSVGKKLWGDHVDALKRAADYAMGRAAKKSGKGLTPKDPALKLLVVELVEIWETRTGEHLKISRKGHEKKPVAAARRFIEAVLADSGAKVSHEQLSNMMLDARKELKRRLDRSADSEASEAKSEE